MVRKTSWRPPSGFRTVASIPQQFRRGTVHEGKVVNLKIEDYRLIGALVDFGAPRRGFVQPEQVRDLEIKKGMRVKVSVERAYDYHGKLSFDLELLEILPEKRPQALKPADPWAGFTRRADWIIFTPEKAGAELSGLYAKRFAHITKVENSGEVMRAWGKNYHVMVPQGFTDAMYSLYDGQEGFDLQLVSLDYKYRESKRWLVAHPSFPEIVLGQVEIENVYGLSVENTAKVKLAGAHAALFEQNKSFAYFLEMMADGDALFLMEPPTR